MTLTKYERWAKARVPRTIHCVRLDDRFKGKLFELLSVEQVDLFPLEDANDFTIEAWIAEHESNLSIMAWEHLKKSRTLKRGEYFMVLDAVTLIEAPLEELDVERLERNGHFSFGADWYWSTIYDGRIWMFEARGRLSVISKKTESVEVSEDS